MTAAPLDMEGLRKAYASGDKSALLYTTPTGPIFFSAEKRTNWPGTR